MTVEVHRVAWADPAAIRLREQMVAEMRVRYADVPGDPIHLPAEEVFAGDDIPYTALALAAGEPAGHLALRWHGPDLELKRMYVVPGRRGRGVAALLLRAAESAGAGLRASRIILETGDRQPEAVRAYEKAGYRPIPAFPPYQDLPYSRCFAKDLA
ncbi:N-acetyltransferase [Actinorhabdospora filicis]|uniref:N-acetyltransferase n=1 Tax=Actinorhabdospora filicis TaxID=1785913 RepID=A0A9W6SRG4_9ACTN|nr:GNAT family N-acetyltransferase [Actinorhabdospora filicis]GLZ81569.1 N-acetyltransferase [Actinorhabdospora filicis]